jgi:two-component system OmpR family response regulator
VLAAGDLELDPARHRVTRGGTELALTPREYSVLEFLMRRSGVVVTKSEIVRSVWDVNYDGDENIVEVYIGYLRKKVDQPFGRKSIETIRGVGYRLAGD